MQSIWMALIFLLFVINFTVMRLNFKVIWFNLKFIYSEKATKFCEIFTLLLTTVHTVKS